MDITVSIDNIRGMVQRLRATVGASVSQSKAYEALSQVLVGKNWDTLSAMLKREPAPKVTLASPVTLIVDTLVTTDGEVSDSADWCKVVIDNEFVNRMLAMEQICHDNGLSHVVETRSAAEWGEFDGPGPCVGVERLCVGRNYWWLQMVPRHCCTYAIESRQIGIQELLDVLLQKKTTSCFVWSQDVLVFESKGNAQHMLELLVQEDRLDSR